MNLVLTNHSAQNLLMEVLGKEYGDVAVFSTRNPSYCVAL